MRTLLLTTTLALLAVPALAACNGDDGGGSGGGATTDAGAGGDASGGGSLARCSGSATSAPCAMASCAFDPASIDCMAACRNRETLCGMDGCGVIPPSECGAPLDTCVTGCQAAVNLNCPNLLFGCLRDNATCGDFGACLDANDG